MNLTQTTKGRLLQIKQGYKADGIPDFENGEFGLVLDTGQEELYIGSNSGNIQLVTERNITQLAVPDGSVGRTELDGVVNTLLDELASGDAIPLVTTSKKGLMSPTDKVKLNGIEAEANKTTIVNNLTSMSTTSALSAYQGRLLKDAIDAVTSGSGVIDNLTSTDTGSALSANQGRILKGLVDNKADKTTATSSTNGLMSSSDKAKLDGISGATTIVNNLTSTSTSSALSAYQGKVVNDKLTTHTGDTTVHITSAERTAWNGKASTAVATTSANGLMSSADKIKLNSIATGANSVTVVDNLTSTSSTNALSANQGRALKALIDGIGSGGGSIANVYQSNVTTGTTGTAFGQYTNATGEASQAVGSYTTASGTYSYASGSNTKATGFVSHANGRSSVASGDYSHACGYSADAIGDYSYASGVFTEATGEASHAVGSNNIASNFASTAMGHYSKMTLANAGSFSSTADAFVIGNGGTSSRSNAFRVKFDGSVYGRSAFNSSGADYAEYFEWSDKNLDNEDRVGYFVTLDGDKIRKANSTDTYVLGIISANASVIGNSASEGWNEQYIRDEFGRIQYHYVDVEYEELDKKGEKITVIKNEYHPVYNSDYDPSLEYTPREDRKEWDAVGMVGILLVRDDGTCEVNGYCSPNDDGIATKSDEGYRVMKRVSDNIIQVLVK